MNGNKSLFLHSKDLNATDVPEILEILSHNPEADTLVLNNNQLGDEGVCLLVAGLINYPNVINLGLRDNQLGDKACEYISQLIQLTDLDLSNNNISDEGVLMASLKKLQNIDLSDNPRITPSALINMIIGLDKLILAEAKGTEVSDRLCRAFDTYMTHRAEATSGQNKSSGFWATRGSNAAAKIQQLDIRVMNQILHEDKNVIDNVIDKESRSNH